MCIHVTSDLLPSEKPLFHQPACRPRLMASSPSLSTGRAHHIRVNVGLKTKNFGSCFSSLMPLSPTLNQSNDKRQDMYIIIKVAQLNDIHWDTLKTAQMKPFFNCGITDYKSYWQQQGCRSETLHACRPNDTNKNIDYEITARSPFNNRNISSS